MTRKGPCSSDVVVCAAIVKLLSMLEKQHGRREELEKLPIHDPKRAGLRNDDRLVTTLLLSALVPEVEPLRGLNAERLAARGQVLGTRLQFAVLRWHQGQQAIRTASSFDSMRARSR